MMRLPMFLLTAVSAAALSTAAATLEAQMPPSVTGPKRAARRAAAAVEVHTTAMTQVEPRAASRGSAAAVPAAMAAPNATTPDGGHAAAPTAGTGRTASNFGAATPSVRVLGESTQISVQREIFAYSAGGRRDPFFSLLNSSELRPMLSDLRLVAVVYDPAGRSVAMLRDLATKEQYRARVGHTLGRMRVTQIHPKSVTFTLEELGFSRQEVLALNDSTTVRKQ